MSPPPSPRSAKPAPTSALAGISLTPGSGSGIQSPAAVAATFAAISPPPGGIAPHNTGGAPDVAQPAPHAAHALPGTDYDRSQAAKAYSFLAKPIDSSSHAAAQYGPEAARILTCVGADIISVASGRDITDEEAPADAPTAKFMDTVFSPNRDGSMNITTINEATMHHLTALHGETFMITLSNNIRIGFTIDVLRSAAENATAFTLSVDPKLLFTALHIPFWHAAWASSFAIMQSQSVLPEPKPPVPTIISITNNPIIANGCIVAGPTMTVIFGGATGSNTPFSIAVAARNPTSGELVNGTARLTVKTAGRAPVCADCQKFATDHNASKIGTSRAASHPLNSSAIISVNGAAQLVTACAAFRMSENLIARMAVPAAPAPGGAAVNRRPGTNNTAGSYAGVAKKATPPRKLSNIAAVMRAKQQANADANNMQQ
jgi:hypothetical protein